ncbi:restriction endonuclease subunit S [Cupriavidus gilardii]|uniref:restriction endonuclease subunit S n=1 Tax=Pseudomonas aeruginosa TaxID=287 RepID=UPI0021C15F7D|nr:MULTISPECIES: restriction endonuclease subunit S [Pseudomonadota]MBX6756558.1 restriction endonuclease subunit S [Pseudomonas aeruginosa]MCT9116270.1 restriction endonuclease subunit S [Cupriavidus gilardii]WMU68846.1 restriction endonuclease subunit S [Pseudomonas aeruginosa]
MTNPNWNWRPLGELFDIGAGKTMSAAARAGADKVPFLRTSNVLWDEIDLTQVDEMSISSTELVDKSLKDGDLLVCEGGEIGRAAVWDGRVPVMSFQNHLHRLRPIQDDVDARFYVYFLQSAFTQLGIFEGAGNKTTIPNLSRNRLAALDVPHPPKPEQQSVAQALAKVREAIAVHDKATSTALELKHAVMNDLFTRGLRGEPHKETEIGLVPESWELAPIGAHHAVVSGGTPSRGNPAFWSGGTIPWAKTTEVDYCVITETEEHITPLGLESSAAKMLPAGTLLMAMYGQGITRGKVAILGIEATCNQACAAITPKDDAVLPRYLYHFLTWRYEAIRSLAHGGQQQNLNLEIVRDLPVVYPQSKDEQDEIVTILDAIDRKIDLHRAKREVLEELFESLLRKLMTGEIAVSDLDLSALSPASTQHEEATA